ncbi:MAG: hypothetical protein QNJ01_16065 [Desulfobacterales bacterium]|nr:hypothetical protein [Desulfobacterales bacterium]
MNDKFCFDIDFNYFIYISMCITLRRAPLDELTGRLARSMMMGPSGSRKSLRDHQQKCVAAGDAKVISIPP